MTIVDKKRRYFLKPVGFNARRCSEFAQETKAKSYTNLPLDFVEHSLTNSVLPSYTTQFVWRYLS